MHKTSLWSGLAGAAAVVTMLLPASLAGQASVGTDVKATAVDTTDRAFVEALAKAHTTEIEAGQNALASSQNPDVRKYAQQLVDDHTKALEKLAPLATRFGVSTSAPMASAIPADVPAVTPAPAPRDSALPSPDAGMGAGAMGDSAAKSSPHSPVTDKQFIDAMVTGHQQLLGKLPEGGRGIKDKEVQKTVSDTRKSVQRHFTMAREIQTKMGGREK